ncbi:prephenate dehydrogenase [Bifidobacterium choloepi]|uniref:Prephenate dehydrogenase/arogenate dehydrogenase family protein n=1 Tax=Bifidobacterium choloepi TaxID=2614131 RepID=A0A6I5NIA2_9BIFI|nr:prephenate dehydrogenase/arogenate dehydrogenase family protein [Bifidobacterium choloepi]NEG70093.1 prephenate dehydrogenase/arogenate dehydrogenase family protein [Bifidobacterium choloepi]
MGHDRTETVGDWVAATSATPATATAGPPAPRRVGIVGLGLIGGSLACRLANAGCDVVAWNHRDHPYRQARRHGIRCVDSLTALAGEKPEVLVLCNPLRSMPDVLAGLRPAFDPAATTLTDVGSVKGLVREQVTAAGLDDSYVGAHPMAGNERSGWQAADPRLFDGALWALTYDERTDYGRLLQVADLVTRACTNRLIVVDDATHDRAAAMISHMPHVASTALINMMSADENRNIEAALAAGSWRDMTRVALTDPKRTEAMVEENAGNVAGLLRDIADRLAAVATALDDGDRAALDRFFAEGDPFRDFKASLDRAGDNEATETIFSSLAISADDWRGDFLRSAQRGEHIVRFTSAHRAIAEQLPRV